VAHRSPLAPWCRVTDDYRRRSGSKCLSSRLLGVNPLPCVTDKIAQPLTHRIRELTRRRNHGHRDLLAARRSSGSVDRGETSAEPVGSTFEPHPNNQRSATVVVQGHLPTAQVTSLDLGRCAPCSAVGTRFTFGEGPLSPNRAQQTLRSRSTTTSAPTGIRSAMQRTLLVSPTARRGCPPPHHRGALVPTHPANGSEPAGARATRPPGPSSSRTHRSGAAARESLTARLSRARHADVTAATARIRLLRETTVVPTTGGLDASASSTTSPRLSRTVAAAAAHLRVPGERCFVYRGMSTRARPVRAWHSRPAPRRTARNTEACVRAQRPGGTRPIALTPSAGRWDAPARSGADARAHERGQCSSSSRH
jgi:hypothetical protein